MTWACREALRIQNQNRAPSLEPASCTLPLQLTPPGALTAHGSFHLVLLCSHPDTVHGFPLRKTRTSTPLIKGCCTEQSPQSGITPTGADCRYRAPLTPRLRDLISISFFRRFVNFHFCHFRRHSSRFCSVCEVL